MKILYSNAFVEDIRDISSYITNELGNPQASEKLLNSFFSEVKRLEESPFLGEQLPPFLRISGVDLRRLVFKNYIIIYRVETETVIAERVFYGRRDWFSILLGETEETENQI